MEGMRASVRAIVHPYFVPGTQPCARTCALLVTSCSTMLPAASLGIARVRRLRPAPCLFSFVARPLLASAGCASGRCSASHPSASGLSP